MRKPYFKKSHKAWYVTVSGKQIRLGTGRDEAFRKYHELMSSQTPVAQSMTVASLFNLFLGWSERNDAPRTHEHHKSFQSSLIRQVPT